MTKNEVCERDDSTLPVHLDRNFRKATYVVEYDHAIEYAGSSFDAASRSVKGLRPIEVWKNHRWMGSVDAYGNWTFKTIYNPLFGSI